MTKAEMYKKLQAYSLDAGYLANVVMCWHKNPAKKLKGMLNLLNAGHTLKLAMFDLLLIDGVAASFCVLEEWSNRVK